MSIRGAKLAVCLLGIAPIWGQSPPVLDLHAALQAAQSDNLELRAARQQRAVALAGIKIAGLIPNPAVSFSAARDTPHESLLWDQPIEIGGKRSNRIGVAREEQKATEIEIVTLDRQVRHRTRDAFYEAILARAETGQAKVALDLSTRTRDAVQARYDAGDVAQLELIQAEVELARAAADYDSAARFEKVADIQLAALLNQPFDRALSLQGNITDLPHIESLQTITETALRSNPELQRVTQQLAIEERRLALAKSSRVPNIDLQAGVDLNSPPDFNVGPRGQIGVTLPLFNRGQGEVAQSNARLELLRLTLQSQRNIAESQVFSAYYDFDSKLRQASAYNATIVPQTEHLEQMAEESYRAGKSNLLTLIDVQRRLNDTRKAYLASLFSVQSAFSALEEAVGVPLD